ncbi:MAG TPA: sterol carrier family protein [Streptomyces sp.]|nr:sterol carrier family protein [Streptomyces sp.]
MRLLTKHLLAVLVTRAPGGAVEVRVPPFAVAQCVEGTRHTRGTPPAVVEMDAATWVALAVGDLGWAEASAAGRVRASGERSDLSPLLPLHP